MTHADVPPPTRRSLRTAPPEDADGTLSALLDEPAPETETETESESEAPAGAGPLVSAPGTALEAYGGPELISSRVSAGPPTAILTFDPLVEISPDPADDRPASDTIALAWVDEDAVAAASRPTRGLVAIDSPTVPAAADLLSSAPRRSPFRPGVIVPILLIAALFGGYAATTLLWPLHAVAPEITAIPVEPVAAAPAPPPWPAQGSAAIAVRGIPGVLASSADPAPIASITKIVTALLVLEEMPLNLGEQGPDFRFTGNDRALYQATRARGESALNIPVGGSLSEYQVLQGMLIGSAGNYADRLASTLWPSDAVYARAARDWLDAHGVTGITIVEPTGFDHRNVATNEALIDLAVKALANPVIAQIVSTPAVDLPGAGHVVNTNDLLADPGVVGVKTGSLDEYNLLSAKDITVAGVTLRLYASVLGQPDTETRSAVSRALYAQLEAEMQPTTAVAAGTSAGIVETKWGDTAKIVTTEAAPVILWNGGAATVDAEYDLGGSRDKGDTVGSLTVTGPFDAKTIPLALDADIEPPTAWWRLTHPLDLFGLAG